MISNILEQEDVVKGMPDAALQQEAQAPSGMLQQFLVISEIKRRTDMRKRHQNQMQEQPQGTVAEQIVMEGITGIAPQQGVGMPPQMGPQQMLPQGGPQMPPQMPPQQPPPGMPPMAAATGGIMRMANGGLTGMPERMRSQACKLSLWRELESLLRRQAGLLRRRIRRYSEKLR